MAVNTTGLAAIAFPNTITTGDSSFPIILENEVRGGLQYVAGTGEDTRLDIAPQRLQYGMLVYDDSDNNFYQYTGTQDRDSMGNLPNEESDWTLYNPGADSSLAALTDVNLGMLEAGDVLAYNGSQWFNKSGNTPPVPTNQLGIVNTTQEFIYELRVDVATDSAGVTTRSFTWMESPGNVQFNLEARAELAGAAQQFRREASEFVGVDFAGDDQDTVQDLGDQSFGGGFIDNIGPLVWGEPVPGSLESTFGTQPTFWFFGLNSSAHTFLDDGTLITNDANTVRYYDLAGTVLHFNIDYEGVTVTISGSSTTTTRVPSDTLAANDPNLATLRDAVPAGQYTAEVFIGRSYPADGQTFDFWFIGVTELRDQDGVLFRVPALPEDLGGTIHFGQANNTLTPAEPANGTVIRTTRDLTDIQTDPVFSFEHGGVLNEAGLLGSPFITATRIPAEGDVTFDRVRFDASDTVGVDAIDAAGVPVRNASTDAGRSTGEVGENHFPTLRAGTGIELRSDVANQLQIVNTQMATDQDLTTGALRQSTARSNGEVVQEFWRGTTQYIPSGDAYNSAVVDIQYLIPTPARSTPQLRFSFSTPNTVLTNPFTVNDLVMVNVTGSLGSVTLPQGLYSGTVRVATGTSQPGPGSTVIWQIDVDALRTAGGITPTAPTSDETETNPTAGLIIVQDIVVTTNADNADPFFAVLHDNLATDDSYVRFIGGDNIDVNYVNDSSLNVRTSSDIAELQPYPTTGGFAVEFPGTVTETIAQANNPVVAWPNEPAGTFGVSPISYNSATGRLTNNTGADIDLSNGRLDAVVDILRIDGAPASTISITLSTVPSNIVPVDSETYFHAALQPAGTGLLPLSDTTIGAQNVWVNGGEIQLTLGYDSATVDDVLVASILAVTISFTQTEFLRSGPNLSVPNSLRSSGRHIRLDRSGTTVGEVNIVNPVGESLVAGNNVTIDRDPTGITINATASGGTITVENNGASPPVNTDARVLNFGTGLTAVQDGTDTNQVNITATTGGISQFAPNTEYAAGDVVWNSNDIYRARSDFTSGASFDVNDWQILTMDTQYHGSTSIFIDPTSDIPNEISFLSESLAWNPVRSYLAGEVFYTDDTVAEAHRNTVWRVAGFIDEDTARTASDFGTLVNDGSVESIGGQGTHVQRASLTGTTLNLFYTESAQTPDTPDVTVSLGDLASFPTAVFSNITDLESGTESDGTLVDPYTGLFFATVIDASGDPGVDSGTAVYVLTTVPSPASRTTVLATNWTRLATPNEIINEVCLLREDGSEVSIGTTTTVDSLTEAEADVRYVSFIADQTGSSYTDAQRTRARNNLALGTAATHGVATGFSESDNNLLTSFQVHQLVDNIVPGDELDDITVQGETFTYTPSASPNINGGNSGVGSLIRDNNLDFYNLLGLFLDFRDDSTAFPEVGMRFYLTANGLVPSDTNPTVVILERNRITPTRTGSIGLGFNIIQGFQYLVDNNYIGPRPTIGSTRQVTIPADDTLFSNFYTRTSNGVSNQTYLERMTDGTYRFSRAETEVRAAGTASDDRLVTEQGIREAIDANAGTTYTFADGTGGTFTVTPSGGSAQTVSVGTTGGGTGQAVYITSTDIPAQLSDVASGQDLVVNFRVTAQLLSIAATDIETDNWFINGIEADSSTGGEQVSAGETINVQVTWNSASVAQILASTIGGTARTDITAELIYTPTGGSLLEWTALRVGGGSANANVQEQILITTPDLPELTDLRPDTAFTVNFVVYTQDRSIDANDLNTPSFWFINNFQATSVNFTRNVVNSGHTITGTATWNGERADEIAGSGRRPTAEFRDSDEVRWVAVRSNSIDDQVDRNTNAIGALQQEIRQLAQGGGRVENFAGHSWHYYTAEPNGTATGRYNETFTTAFPGSVQRGHRVLSSEIDQFIRTAGASEAINNQTFMIVSAYNAETGGNVIATWHVEFDNEWLLVDSAPQDINYTGIRSLVARGYSTRQTPRAYASPGLSANEVAFFPRTVADLTAIRSAFTSGQERIIFTMDDGTMVDRVISSISANVTEEGATYVRIDTGAARGSVGVNTAMSILAPDSSTRAESITLVSPDGTQVSTLSLDNSGALRIVGATEVVAVDFVNDPDPSS